MSFKDLAASSISLALTVSIVAAPWNEALAAESVVQPDDADAAATDADADDAEAEGGEAGVEGEDADPAGEELTEEEAAALAEAEAAEAAAAEAAAEAELEEASEAAAADAEGEKPEASIDDLYPEPQFGGKFPATGRGMIIAGTVIASAGAAAVITSALITTCPYEENTRSCTLAPQQNLFIPMSIAVTAVGAMLLGAGFGYKARYGKWQKKYAEAKAERGAEKSPEPTAILAPVLMQRGGGFVYAGRF